MNSAFITLVSKKDRYIRIKEYQPTRPVTSMYKIIRLNEVSKPFRNQSTFIARRQILDKVLVVNDMVDDVKRKGNHGLFSS